MALNQTEKEAIGVEVTAELSKTTYACTSLTVLSGGTANFIFRGTLVMPLPDGSQSIIIKHLKEYVAANRNFKLDVSRSDFEEMMLNVMDSFPAVITDNFSVRTPHLQYSNCNTNTHILEDLVGTMDMKTMLVTDTKYDVLTQPMCIAIGRALGHWLRGFHNWTSAPGQVDLRDYMSGNKAMREVRYGISYGAFIDVVRKFPEIWEENREVLERVKNMAAAEYANTNLQETEESWTIVHGDFWSGNVLTPDPTTFQNQQSEGGNVFVIDWELAQYGRKEYDLGQMIGDLYERKHFEGLGSALWILQAFVSGYGVLSDKMAFRTAIHAGVHLICWYIRRDPNAPFTEAPEQIQDAIRIGTDFIVKGWMRDLTWFEGSPLACLFKHG